MVVFYIMFCCIMFVYFIYVYYFMNLVLVFNSWFDNVVDVLIVMFFLF